MEQPNPLKVVLSILRVLRRVRPPSPMGTASVDHSGLEPVLAALAGGGLRAVPEKGEVLDSYLSEMAQVDVDALNHSEALAFWINVYNAGAISLAVEASGRGDVSVLRTPNGFSRTFLTIGGEELSLDAVEHAKIRRFGDPRIHGALVCGSLSCPTLRPTPFTGDFLEAGLDAQMKVFLGNGGAVEVSPGRIELSRIFRWYGGDFVRPQRMPTFVPPRKSALIDSLRPWLPTELSETQSIGFQEYDWSLGCAVG